MREEQKTLQTKNREQQEINLKLQTETDQRASTINTQNNIINYNSYTISQINAIITQLEKRKQGIISWLGKMSGLSEDQIDYLRLNCDIEVMLSTIDNALKDKISNYSSQP
jgi:hypothetical protein